MRCVSPSLAKASSGTCREPGIRVSPVFSAEQVELVPGVAAVSTGVAVMTI